jgi:hypothetical protein
MQPDALPPDASPSSRDLAAQPDATLVTRAQRKLARGERLTAPEAECLTRALHGRLP